MKVTFFPPYIKVQSHMSTSNFLKHDCFQFEIGTKQEFELQI